MGLYSGGNMIRTSMDDAVFNDGEGRPLKRYRVLQLKHMKCSLKGGIQEGPGTSR